MDHDGPTDAEFAIAVAERTLPRVEAACNERDRNA
jgi:hypothetical protein